MHSYARSAERKGRAMVERKVRRGEKMSEIKLKPCPFCGCDAAMFMLDDRYTARCRSCFCGTGEYKDPERASETWNRRADDETD